MRRLALVLPLSLAACMRAPIPVAPNAPPPEPARAERTDLLGLSASAVESRFGAPALTVAEGPGTKLQWRANGCVLDAYLYSPENARGEARVTHVDARDRDGRDIDRATCEAQLEAAR